MIASRSLACPRKGGGSTGQNENPTFAVGQNERFFTPSDCIGEYNFSTLLAFAHRFRSFAPTSRLRFRASFTETSGSKLITDVPGGRSQQEFQPVADC